MTTNFTAGIVGLGSYLPGESIPTDFFFGEDGDPSAESPVLRAPAGRHHVRPGERAAAMVEQAALPLFERTGIDPAEVDVLLTNVLLPDLPLTGCGAEVADLLACAPEWILDVHNGGCASFPYMLKIASALFAAGSARTALLCNVQNTAGQIFQQPEVRDTPQAAVPGDGCGVALLRADGGSQVLAVETRNDPRRAADMGLSLPGGRRYWEAGEGPLDIQFDQAAARQIVERGNKLVPAVVERLCERLGVGPGEIDALVTNQPNRIFLRNWRRTLGIDEERHLDTFDELGNLYGAGVPVTLSRAEEDGRLRSGDLVVIAGFAHAGDFAAAAALRWEAPPLE